MARPSQPQRGFTLVELLVVIGIIAVLIGILLPVLGRARDQANTTSCMATLRNLGQALAIYTAENKGSYPYSYYTDAATGGGAASVGDSDASVYVWWSVLRAYMRRGGSPDNSILNSDGSIRSTRLMKAFACPEGHEPEAGCDFGSNMVIMPELPWETITYASVPNYRKMLRPLKATKLYPDNIVLWDACELSQVAPPWSRQYVCGYDLDSGYFSNPQLYYKLRFRGLAPDTPQFGDNWPIHPGSNVDDQSVGTRGNIRWRHTKNTAANFLFADGTVRTFKITKNAVTTSATGDALRKYFRPKTPSDFR